jgi:hypothetical protein
MFRLLLYLASALNFCVLDANAAERYGEWLLEQPRGSVLTLPFKQAAPLDDKMATSELGFICDRKEYRVKNERGAIPILVQKNSDQFDSSDLSQKMEKRDRIHLFGVGSRR